VNICACRYCLKNSFDTVRIMFYKRVIGAGYLVQYSILAGCAAFRAFTASILAPYLPDILINKAADKMDISSGHGFLSHVR